MKRTNKKKGGLVCRSGFSTIKPFDLFMKMINNETAKISSISYNSLFGFIFKLDIDPIANSDDPEEEGFYVPDNTHTFLQLNKEHTEYNEPVYSLVIKMVLLSSDGEHELPDYAYSFSDNVFGPVAKESQKTQDFIDEGEIQSEIYKSTVSKGDPISLPVAVNSILETPVALSFISNILEYKTLDKLSRHMLKYIFDTLTRFKTLQLGVLVMESATDLKPIFIPMYNQKPGAIRGLFYPKRKSAYDKMYSSIINKLALLIIRLYIETGYIHKDLHLNNAMVNSDADNLILRIIDYGKVVKNNSSYFPISFFTTGSKKTVPQSPGELLGILKQITENAPITEYYLTYFISSETLRGFLLDNIKSYYEKPDIIPDCYSKVTTSYPTIEDVNHNSSKTGGRTKKTARKRSNVQLSTFLSKGVKRRTAKRRPKHIVSA